jgi:PTS system nitrogen regulatory IIA component
MSTKDQFGTSDLTIVMPNVAAKTQREVFEIISAQIAEISGISSTAIFTRLMQKEKDQSSATGNGVAIPHARFLQLKESYTLLMTLKNKIDFNANDSRHTDIICVLISPRADGVLHLQRLSKISRTLKNAKLCEEIRAARTEQDLRRILYDPQNMILAA